MVKVHYIEGVAIHDGPESCGYSREAMREALTGECTGQPLSCEILFLLGADALGFGGRQYGQARYASACLDSTWSQDPGMYIKLFTREPGGLRNWPVRWSATGPHWKGEEP